MHWFLTEKGKSVSLWELPALAGSGILAAISAHACIDEFRTDPSMMTAAAAALVMALFLTPVRLLVRRWLRRRQAQKLASALNAVRGDSVPLEDFDRIAGIPEAGAKVQELFDQGFLRNVQLDEAARRLRLLGRVPADAPEPAPEPAPEQTEETEDPAGILRRMRRLNDEIADPRISACIDRFEAVTASMFRTVRERPELSDSLRRFMDYYLPTAFRLLESYRLMERQAYQGENIQGAREKIEAAMEKLVTAVEQQQDRLFHIDGLDVEAEIRVLETMMAADGLSDPGGLRKAAAR